MKSPSKSYPGKTLTVGLVVLCLLPLGVLYSEVARDKLVVPDSGYVQVMTTKDGSSIIGRILEVGENEIRYETAVGTLIVPIANIEKLEAVPQNAVKKGKYWFPNPNTSRLFVSPTARPLSKGKGYVTDYMLFVPYVAYGITPNISIEGGMTLIPGLGFGQIVYFRPKIGFSLGENVAVAGGIMGAFNLPFHVYYDEMVAFNCIYGVASFLTPDNTLSLGLAYGGFTQVGWGTEWMQYPAIMLGGEFRLARGVSFVTENYYVPDLDEEMVAVSYGLRFFGQHFSVDAGFANAIGYETFSEIFPGIPFAAVTYNF